MILELLLQATLCFVLTAAVAGKIANWDRSIQWIARLGLHRPRLALTATLAVEFAVVLVVAVAPTIAAPAGLAFIAGATVVLRIAESKGLGCACFGPDQRVAARSFVRNGLIAAGFLALAVVAPTTANAPGASSAALAIAVTAPAVVAIRTLEQAS